MDPHVTKTPGFEQSADIFSLLKSAFNNDYSILIEVVRSLFDDGSDVIKPVFSGPERNRRFPSSDQLSIRTLGIGQIGRVGENEVKGSLYVFEQVTVHDGKLLTQYGAGVYGTD
jgi:hypothetical protein